MQQHFTVQPISIPRQHIKNSATSQKTPEKARYSKINAYLCTWKHTGIAQSVEHWSPKPGVGSSSLSSRASKIEFRDFETRSIKDVSRLFFSMQLRLGLTLFCCYQPFAE